MKLKTCDAFLYALDVWLWKKIEIVLCPCCKQLKQPCLLLAAGKRSLTVRFWKSGRVVYARNLKRTSNNRIQLYSCFLLRTLISGVRNASVNNRNSFECPTSNIHSATSYLASEPVPGISYCHYFLASMSIYSARQ